MTRVNQGLFSTTMEAEKRDPGNEVVTVVKFSVMRDSDSKLALSFSFPNWKSNS